MFFKKIVRGAVTDVIITKSAMAGYLPKRFQWIPHGFGDENYERIWPRTVIYIQDERKHTIICAMDSMFEEPELGRPDIGKNIEVIIDKIGGYEAIMGNERRFKDGTINRADTSFYSALISWKYI